MKLEEEAASIALATEEEYTQYQQLKQVQLPVSVPWISLEVDTSSVRWHIMRIVRDRSGILLRRGVHMMPLVAEHQCVTAFQRHVHVLC